MSTLTLAQQLYRLEKNVASLSASQATCEVDDATGTLKLAVIPRDGLYAQARVVFELQFDDEHLYTPPHITVQPADLYHPNVSEGLLCLNILADDWTSTTSVEDIVQGLLFLLHNPQWSDALNDEVACYPTLNVADAHEAYRVDIRRYLLGIRELYDDDFDSLNDDAGTFQVVTDWNLFDPDTRERLTRDQLTEEDRMLLAKYQA